MEKAKRRPVSLAALKLVNVGAALDLAKAVVNPPARRPKPALPAPPTRRGLSPA